MYFKESPEWHHVLPSVAKVSAFSAKCQQSVTIDCKVSPECHHFLLGEVSPECHQVLTGVTRCHHIRPSVTECHHLLPNVNQSVTIYCQVSQECQHLLQRVNGVSPFTVMCQQCHHLLQGVYGVSPFTAWYHQTFVAKCPKGCNH